MAINLFDFTKQNQQAFNPLGAALSQPKQLAQAPVIPGVIMQQVKATNTANVLGKKLDKPKPSSIIPQAQAEESILDKYMTDASISKEGKKKMIADLSSGKITELDANEIIANIYSKKQPEKEGFFSGVGTKIGEQFKSGIGLIQKSGEEIAGTIADENNVVTNTFNNLVKGGIGAVRAVTSPITGLAGQVIEEGIGVIPESVKKPVSEFVEPKAKKLMNWYESQTPEQKKNLEDIGIGVEGLLNFTGLKAAQKVAPAIKEGVIKGAEKTGETILKTGKALARTPGLIKKGASAIDEGIETGVEKLAGKVLGSSDGSKELFKATSPSYNTLSKAKDIKNIVSKAKLADEAIVEYGFKPINTTERVAAYKDTMKKVWNEVEKVRGKVSTKFDAKKLADTIDEEIAKLSVDGTINPAIKGDVDALLKQADYFRKIGNIDIPTLGNQRTLINAVTDWGSTTQFGNTFSNVMKKVAGKIKESEDLIIGGIGGGKVSDKLSKYGALRSMYDDIVKQDIKALRAKGMGIEESFGRIAGISEALGGVAQLAFNPKNALPSILSGGSKVLLGKVAGKLKDVDYLIKTGYEKLLKSKPLKNGNLPRNITAPGVNLNRSTLSRSIPKEITGIIPKGKKFTNIFGESQNLPSNKKGGFVKLPGKSDPLIAEAKKYKSAEEFVDALYKEKIPGQVYRPRGIQDAIKIREEGGSLAGYDLQSKIEFLGGQYPADKITIYRATKEGKTILPGDYITNSFDYAKQHIRDNLGGKGKITKIEASLDDIFPADGPKEFWYAPKYVENINGKEGLKKIWGNANKK